MIRMTNHITGHHEEKQDDLLEHGERAQIDGRQAGHGQGRVAQEEGIDKCCGLLVSNAHWRACLQKKTREVGRSARVMAW